MALLTNRFNAQSYNQAVFAGSAGAWAVKRLRLLQNMYASQAGVDDLSGIPNGYNTGLMLLPLKAGGMSSFNPAILNLVKTNADAKMGRGLEGSATLSLVSTNAQADQIVPMIASASLATTLSDAGMSAGVQAVADSAMSITGNASLGGIIPIQASSSCVITPDVVMTALAFMVAEAGGPTELSPEGLAAAVWDAPMSDFQESGSTGERVQKLLTKNQFLGLK